MTWRSPRRSFGRTCGCFVDATTYPHLIPPFLAGSKRSCGHPSSPTLSLLCSAALRPRGSSRVLSYVHVWNSIRAVLMLCVRWGELLSAHPYGLYCQCSCRRGLTPSVTMYYTSLALLLQLLCVQSCISPLIGFRRAFSRRSAAVSHTRGHSGRGTVRTRQGGIGHLDARRVSTSSRECGPLGSEVPCPGPGA